MEETINLIIQKAKEKIQNLDTERILCYAVDVNGKILSGRTISKNNHKGFTFLDVGKFLNMLGLDKVFYIVMVHNHPNSTMATSDDDDKMTKYINRYCDNYGITLYDHIIVMRNSENVYSYRKEKRYIKTYDKPNFCVKKKECANG